MTNRQTDRRTDGRTDGQTDGRPGKNNRSPDPKGGRHNGSLMKVERIAECSPLSILQYFCPALSYNQS